MERVTIEVCVESVDGALAAQSAGADRVELCGDLLEGGTTPSAGTIELARMKLSIGLHVIIRPRGGDFCYSEIEFETMRRDVRLAKQLGVDGVVFGLLEADGSIDELRTAELVQLAKPLSVTFHRAFDMTRDPYEALERLVGLEVERVLTTGQEESALKGLDLIADLVKKAGERIVLMPGGDLGLHMKKVLERTRAKEIHFAALEPVESCMRHRNNRCFMGPTVRSSEFTRLATQARNVKEIIDVLRHASRRQPVGPLSPGTCSQFGPSLSCNRQYCLDDSHSVERPPSHESGTLLLLDSGSATP